MNPKVFFQIRLGTGKIGKIVMELYKDKAPSDFVENFRALCTGEHGKGAYGKPLHYKGSRFHKVIKGLHCMGGDIIEGTGLSGENIYYNKEMIIRKQQNPAYNPSHFEMRSDPKQYMECPQNTTHLSHRKGCLSMANCGTNRYRSQFFITFKDIPMYDKYFLVIGSVIEDKEGILDSISECGSLEGEVDQQIVIEDCGEVEQGGSGGASTSAS